MQPAGTQTGVASRPAYGSIDVRDHGAIADGHTLDTAAIQQAIDAAAGRGGGTVLLSSGRYLSGSLFLKSHITLRIEAGATLLASPSMGDYETVVPAFDSRSKEVPCPSLIYAENQHDVTICGEGKIDGQGAAFPRKRGLRRPYVLRFVSCRRVRVENVTLLNSPGWMQHYLACDDVAIHGIRVLSHAHYNNDMMDIDCCRDVRISDCLGDTGDDGITLKSTGNRACENVTVTNCIISSHCNAIKLGTESNGGFKNITVSNCVIRPSESREVLDGAPGGLAGVALESVDGGVLDQVVVSNITMTGVTAPLFLRLGNRARPVLPGSPPPDVGALRNVIISNIVADEAGQIGCAIAGIPDHRIENVTLRHVRISMAGGGTRAQASASMPEREQASPECTMFGALPAYGFCCRHVENLSLQNVEVRPRHPDFRSVLVCDDVRQLDIAAFSGQSVTGGEPVIALNDVRGARVRDCVAPRGTQVFLRLSGNTGSVVATGNDLHAAATPFEMMTPVAQQVLFQSANRLPP